MRKTFSIILAMVFAVFLSVTIVNAAAANKPLAATTGQAIAAQKLTEAKLKVCQNKEAAIKKRGAQLTNMVNNMLIKFDSITTRVETYYTDKVLPSGKTVSDYDALVAEIAAKKSAVQTDLDKASIDAAAFVCTSDDPKGQLTQFRIDMQAVKQGLRDYRISIKNLIVAIRSIIDTTESTPNSESNQ